MTDNEGWLDKRAAIGQCEAFREALAKSPNEVPPFRGFLKAMEYINPKSGTILDVGCGVGGYATLVDRYWPQLDYLGCDISPHMIEFAKEDYGDRFFVADVMDLNQGATIILASGVVEVCPDWPVVLTHLLGLPFSWLILNRVRVWNGIYHPTQERWYKTGPGISSFEVTHEQVELHNLIRVGGGFLVFTYAYQVEVETTLLTMVVVNANTFRNQD